MDRVPDLSRVIPLLVIIILFLVFVAALIHKKKDSRNLEVWNFTLLDLGIIILYLIVGATCILYFSF